MAAPTAVPGERAGRDGPLAIRLLTPAELPAAAGAAARALQDDPTNVASYGDDPLVRLAMVHKLFVDVFGQTTVPQYGAVAGDCVVAVAGVVAPGRCVGTMMGPMAAEVLAGPEPPLGDPWRASRFWATWALHDLPGEHWHIGPVGVEPALQGMGIGRAVMEGLCAELDEHGRIGWLETNRERNVRFYSALGFEVVDEAVALGVPNWFMRRDPVPPGR
ncbi:MAG TPA: GNAT family N-acetyltransferase [Acidimicrobiales bacterium]|nr:GNAT family N-acetyltransferase [Acidimicrobiales bacterium]